jgi:septum formation protein
MLLSFDFVVKISPLVAARSILPAIALENSSPSCATRNGFKSMPPHLVLASTSPFRRELLGRLNLPFDVAAPSVDESPLPSELPAQTALRLSESKARAVASAFPGALIIGSDQVAHIGNRIFGKPGTHERAAEQLRMLSGQAADFVTGVCLYNASSGAARSRTVTTRVTFRELNDGLIERYLRAEMPYNCAGSAKSEGLGVVLIAKMECSDPTALIGLPLIALCDLLEEEKICPV